MQATTGFSAKRQPAAKPAPATGGYLGVHSRPVATKTRANFIPAQSWLSYNHVDKDPELDFVCWAIESSGKSVEWIERETEKLGLKVSRYTMLNWLYGSTRNSFNSKMNTVMYVLGYHRRWERG
jgi:hypothetical protein